MVFIQLKDEAQLAELIDILRRSKKVSDGLRDKSAHWENAYFGEQPETPAVKVFGPIEISGRVETIRRVR
jgi:hypothetical protein